MVNYLHERGFDINGTDPVTGLTPLIWAAKSGNLELVKWLVEKKVDVNKVENHSLSALHVASLMGHIPVMEYLLQQGMEIDSTVYKDDEV